MSVINTMLRDLEMRRVVSGADQRLLDDVAVVPHAGRGRSGGSWRAGFGAAGRSFALSFVVAALLAVAGLYARSYAQASAQAKAQPKATQLASQQLSGPASAFAAAATARAQLPATPPVEQAAASAEAEPADENDQSLPAVLFTLATSMASVAEASLPAAKNAARSSADMRQASPAAQTRSASAAAVLPEQGVTPTAATAPTSDAPTETAIHVERSVQTLAERNLIEVQHAAELQRRGALAEAEASLRAVLSSDKSMVAARLALFSLLQRQQRIDDARQVLKEGAAIAPVQSALLLPYARWLAARNEWSSAYDALAPAADALTQDAEYRALCGVVLQRLSRFPQSVAEYKAALRLSPSVSAWWLGLALSLEGDGRPSEARAAYSQARSAPLTPELAQFVEGKLQRLAAAE